MKKEIIMDNQIFCFNEYFMNHTYNQLQELYPSASELFLSFVNYVNYESALGGFNTIKKVILYRMNERFNYWIENNLIDIIFNHEIIHQLIDEIEGESASHGYDKIASLVEADIEDFDKIRAKINHFEKLCKKFPNLRGEKENE